MAISRRSLIMGLLAAPAVILTPKLLMPVKALALPPQFAKGDIAVRTERGWVRVREPLKASERFEDIGLATRSGGVEWIKPLGRIHVGPSLVWESPTDGDGRLWRAPSRDLGRIAA